MPTVFIMSNSSENSFTNRAAVTALPFTLVPIVFDVLKHFTENITFLVVTISFLKIGVITAVLYTIMKKFTMDEGYVPYGRSFRYGFAMCTFSSIICTLWYILNIYVIFPDQMEKILEMLTTTLGQMNTGIEYDQISRFLPPALIISSFISCEIWGLILTGILANFTKNDSPFANGSVTENETTEEE